MPPYKPVEIRRRLEELGVSIRSIASGELASQANAFKEVLLQDKEWTEYYNGIISDKWLEHFLSMYCLSPKSGDVMLDVASHWSPFWKIVQKTTGVKSIYLQDLCFESGIHDNRIGSDCIDIPLNSSTVDVISVNNSIEHFEGNKDQLFLNEAYRLLKPGGRLCIVPLFINSVLVNMADPAMDLSSVAFDEGAVLVSASPWKLPFARYYTPETFVKRLVQTVPQFNFEVIEVLDMVKFDPSLHYWQFVALLHKPAG